MNWKIFSINKQESLVDILKKYSEKEIREAIPEAFENCHFSKNPFKKVNREKKVEQEADPQTEAGISEGGGIPK